MSATITLSVNVLDVLDPAPTFSEGIYAAQLLEDTYSNVNYHLASCYVVGLNTVPTQYSMSSSLYKPLTPSTQMPPSDTSRLPGVCPSSCFISFVETVCECLDDASDSLFSIESSGENAGQVSLTGILDRETDTTFTTNIRVSFVMLG